MALLNLVSRSNFHKECTALIEFVFLGRFFRVTSEETHIEKIDLLETMLRDFETPKRTWPKTNPTMHEKKN